MAVTHLSYKSKSQPDLLSEVASEQREHLLAAYARLAERAGDPVFHYPGNRRPAEFVTAAKDTAVEAVNSDLIRLAQGELTLRITDHAKHAEETFTVQPKSPRKPALAHALIEAYEHALPAASKEEGPGERPTTFLQFVQGAIARTELAA